MYVYLTMKSLSMIGILHIRSKLNTYTLSRIFIAWKTKPCVGISNGDRKDPLFRSGKKRDKEKKITRRMRYVGNSVRVYFSRVKKKKMQRKTREKERERERDAFNSNECMCVCLYSRTSFIET